MIVRVKDKGGVFVEILVEYKGLKLIQKYGQYYIRFTGGQYEEIPCDLHITDQEASAILAQPDELKKVRDVHKKLIRWKKDYFVDSALRDYLFHVCGLKDETIEIILKQFDTRNGIKMELYELIMYKDETKTQDSTILRKVMDQYFHILLEDSVSII